MAEHVPHYLHVFPTFAPAGAQVRTVQLMNAMAGEARHSVVSLKGSEEARELIDPGVECSMVIPRSVDGPLSGLRSARATLRELRPDALLTYNWGSFDWVLAGRVLGPGRHLHHEDGFNADEALGQKSRRVWARRWGLRRSRLIVPSSQLADIATGLWKLRDVHLVPNGVHLDRFDGVADGSALRAELGIPAEALVVGAVGHLRPVKNFSRLMRSVARIPKELAEPGVHLIVFGDGEERSLLEGLRASCSPPGGRIHLAGHRSDLVPCYAALDLLAISSDSEQLPVSLLEAMACGVPVVSTRVGDVAQVLPPEAASEVVPLEEADVEGALARAMGTLLADPERRGELARLGRRRAEERYSFQAMLATYREHYRRAAGLPE